MSSPLHLLLLSATILLCFFLLARPLLYFCYFLFLFPYAAFNLLAFLYPLLLTTTAFLLLLVANHHHHLSSSSSSSSSGYLLLLLYHSLLNSLRLGDDDCFHRKINEEDECLCVEDFGMFEMLFGSPPQQTLEEEEETPLQLDASHIGGEEKIADNRADFDSIPTPKLEKSSSGTEKQRLQNFLKILDQFEKMSSSVEEEKKTKCAKTNKVVEKIESKATTPRQEHHQLQRHVSASSDSADDFGASDRYNLGTYGSMRHEREWKRTLACKLFEERHNVGNGEGMDSLWEAYEMDSSTTNKPKNEKKKKKKKTTAAKKQVVKEEEEEEEGEEESVIDEDKVQMCCLQAIKLSTGKMNFGMGRPNLVKITKAIKGIGWLHHATKHSKKVHNNGDRY